MSRFSKYSKSLLLGLLLANSSLYAFDDAICAAATNDTFEESNKFITKWKVDNVGEEISIYVGALGYTLNNPGLSQIMIDWGDNNTTYYEYNMEFGEISHVYENPGTYTVKAFEVSTVDGSCKIKSDFNHISINPTYNLSHKLKLLSIDNWGGFRLLNNTSFNNYINLEINATDNLKGIYISHMTNTFNGIKGWNTDISDWDISYVSTMKGTFSNTANFNQDISSWDVSRVINMENLFKGASDFNQSLNNWDVSKVTKMNGMFEGAISFDQPLNNWNTSELAYAENMFKNASSFNQDLNNWDVSKLTFTESMFEGASLFDGNISTWNTDTIHGVEYMFKDASSFNQALKNWNISKVISFEGFLKGASSFNQPLNDWNMSKVTNIGSMFHGASSFNQPLNDWNISKVTKMSSIFNGAEKFNQDINNWDVSKVTQLHSIFTDATDFNKSINNWDVSNVTMMTSLFKNASSFNQPLNDWNTSKTSSLLDTFEGASSFNQPLNNWDVSNISSIQRIFKNASNFNQSLENWDLNTHKMEEAFNGATNYNQKIGDWNLSTGKAYDSENDQYLVYPKVQNMFEGVTLSNENYDDLLIKFASYKPGRASTETIFSGGNSKYCAGKYAKKLLIEKYKWNITDGGEDCPVQAPSGLFIDDKHELSIKETLVSEDSIGFIRVVDFNDDNFTYKFVSNGGVGSADNSHFIIEDGKVKLNFNPNFDTPIDANGDNIYEIAIEVNDNASGTFIQTFKITILDVTLPKVTSSDIVMTDEDNEYVYTLQGTVGDGSSLSWSVSADTPLPSWLKLVSDGSGTRLVGTPLNEHTGTKTISLVLDDGENKITHTFSLNIKNINDLPKLILDSNLSASGSGGFSDLVELGDNGFGQVEYFYSMGIDNKNIPYVIYRDDLKNGNITVKRFDGTSWILVGEAGFASSSDYGVPTIVFSSNNIPYISSNGSQLKIMKYENDNWVNVGSNDVGSGSVKFSSLSLDKNDIPYVVYSDVLDNNNIFVKKLNGSSWETVGENDLANIFTTNNKIVFDNNNIPYISFAASEVGEKLSVKKFVNSSWEQVGNFSISDGQVAQKISFVFDSQNVPYLNYNDGSIQLKKFNGTKWENIFLNSSINGSYTSSLVLDSDDNLYITTMLGSLNLGSFKFNGTKWEDIQPEKIITGITQSIDSFIDNKNNIYLSFLNSNKFSVKKLVANSTPNLNVEENKKLVLKDLNATDEDDTELTFGIVGIDASHFDINSTTGKVEFKNLTDFETPVDDGANNVYDINITVSDTNGGVQHTPIKVTVTDVEPETPYGITISNDSLDENNEVEKIIGTLDASAFGEATIESYALVDGFKDNDKFNINDNNQVVINESANFEVKNNYELQIKVTDTLNRFTDADLNITVNDINEAPVWNIPNIPDSQEDLSLTIESSTTDAENNSISYSLENHSTDLADISIVDGKIVVNPKADQHGTVSLTVWAYDGENNVSKEISFEIKNVNDAPQFAVKIAYDPVVVQDESSYSNLSDAVIQSFVWDSEETFKSIALDKLDHGTDYNVTIYEGADFTNKLHNENISAISNPPVYSVLEFATPLNLIRGNKYIFRVQHLDENKITIRSICNFSTGITPYVDGEVFYSNGRKEDACDHKFRLNESFSELNTDIKENSTNALQINASDADHNASELTYGIYFGNISGNEDRNLFNIDSTTGMLSFKQAPDFENPSDYSKDNKYSLFVQVKDPLNESDITHVIVNVTDVDPEGPQEIKVTPNSIDENNVNGVVVGKFSATAFGESTVASYALTDASDYNNSKFTINDNNQLVFNDVVNYEEITSYAIKLKVMDSLDRFTIKTLKIDVNDINELPILTSSPTLSIDQDGKYTYALSGTDEENSSITWSATNLPTWLTLTGSSLSGTPTNKEVGTHAINLIMSDGENNVSHNFTINVKNVNDNPDITIGGTITTNEDNNGSVVFSYVDIDDDIVSATLKTQATNGTVKINGTNVIYTPNENYNGDDSFVLTISDGHGYEADYTINVTVNSVDDLPILVTIGNQVVNEDSAAIRIDLSTSDVDSDVSNAVYNAKSSNTKLATVKIVDGKLIVIPKENATGIVTIEVNTTVDGKTDTKVFTYTLNEVNDNPTIENIADISLEQDSSNTQSNNILFSIWDDVNVTSLTVVSKSTNELLVSNILVQKIHKGRGELKYTIASNQTGVAKVTVTANDGELTYNENFNIVVKPANDALCVEDTKSALSFDTIKGENLAQNYISRDLNLVSTLSSVCSSTITWKISDVTVINGDGIVTKGSEDQTVEAVATIKKGNYETTKQFLLTIPSLAVNDIDALNEITFEMIKKNNQRKKQIASSLNLISSSLGKDIVWTSSNADVIDLYTGVVTKQSTDTNVTLSATINGKTKTFELVVLKNETSDKNKMLKDKQWLNFARILDKNRDNDHIIYNLIKPLPSTLETPNGSTITWQSSNEDVITADGDVFRDTLEDKVVKLTANILNGSETSNKEFTLTVLKNAIVKDTNTTFKRIDDLNNSISIVYDKDNQESNTTATFDTTLNSIVEKVISEDSVKSIFDFVDKVLNLYLNTDGTTQSQTESLDANNNSVVSSVMVNLPKSQSNVDANGTVQTDVDVDENTIIHAKLNLDGSVSHQVDSKEFNTTTTATANLPGSKVEVKDSGIVETTTPIALGGYIYKAIAISTPNGKTKTRFVRIDIQTGIQNNIANTLSDDTPYEAGNNVTIEDINGTIYIKTTAPLGEVDLLVE